MLKCISLISSVFTGHSLLLDLYHKQYKMQIMKKLEVISGWMESDPSDYEIKRVESLISRMVISRSRRVFYDLSRKYQKMLKLEKEMKDLGVQVPVDFQKSLKDIKNRVEEVRKSIPEVTRKVEKEK